jgi:hypothetical protein
VNQKFFVIAGLIKASKTSSIGFLISICASAHLDLLFFIRGYFINLMATTAPRITSFFNTMSQKVDKKC